MQIYEILNGRIVNDAGEVFVRTETSTVPHPALATNAALTEDLMTEIEILRREKRELC